MNINIYEEFCGFYNEDEVPDWKANWVEKQKESLLLTLEEIKGKTMVEYNFNKILNNDEAPNWNASWLERGSNLKKQIDKLLLTLEEVSEKLNKLTKEENVD